MGENAFFIRRDKNYIELLEHLIKPNLEPQPFSKNKASVVSQTDSEDSTWEKSIKTLLEIIVDVYN